MSSFQIISHAKRKIPVRREPDSDMAEVLEVTDRKFKIIMTHKLRALMEKVANMQEQMG